MKKLTLFVAIILSLAMLGGCSSKIKYDDDDILDIEKNPTGNIVIVVESSDGKKVEYDYEFELYYKEAPNTVVNFISLIESGYYDNSIFHRKASMGSGNGSVLQGGGYTYNYEDDELVNIDPLDLGYSIFGEFANNGWTNANSLKHYNGTLAMARTSEMDSASDQFYINLGDNFTLDKNYAVFGKITNNEQTLTNDLTELQVTSFSGTDLVNFSDFPVDKVYIGSIDVDTHGVDFGKVLKIKI